MDELELLKKDWQKKEGMMPKLSYDEIYSMIWKKSSSIVKWIFIISIIEFILPHLLYLLPSVREDMGFYEQLGVKNLMIGISIFNYIVVFYFIFQFYKRYREISVLENARDLMRRIIRTRRTVKHYIIFALSLFLFSFLAIASVIYFSDGEHLITVLNLDDEAKDLSPGRLKALISFVFIIVGILFTALIGLIYFLIYGLLIRKLGRNYNELKRLEI
ncbi:MAG: hypothetical protein WBM43_05835 [Flavobacteriaceae bacterium]